MTIDQILSTVANDKQSLAILGAILLDLILGIIASVVRPDLAGPFRLTYLANFARNDVLGKAVPFFILDAFSQVAGGANILIPGLDLTNVTHGAFVVLIAAFVGSILSSLTDLGFSAIPSALGGHATTGAVAPPPPQ